jgi:hypothetical protein
MNKDLKMISLGDLINRIVYANTAISNSYKNATYTQKHLMKTYTGAAHGLSAPYFASVRADVITWFNGHR